MKPQYTDDDLKRARAAWKNWHHDPDGETQPQLIARLIAEERERRAAASEGVMSGPGKEANELAAELFGMTLDQAIPRLQKLIDDRERAEDAAGRIAENYLVLQERKGSRLEADDRVAALEAKCDLLAASLRQADARLTSEIAAHRVTLEDRASWESRAMDLEAKLSSSIKECAAMDALHNQAWDRGEAAEAEQSRLQKALDVCSVVHAHNASLKTRAEAAERKLDGLQRLDAAAVKMAGPIAERVARGGPAKCTTIEVFEQRARDLLADPDPSRAVAKELADWMQQAYSLHAWVTGSVAHAAEAERKLAELVREVREWLGGHGSDSDLDGIVAKYEGGS
jgi:chromosome segregation ATPase